MNDPDEHTLDEAWGEDPAGLDQVQYVAEIEWSDPKLPRLVGPFQAREEALEWCRLNAVSGSWNAAPLAWPYLRVSP